MLQRKARRSWSSPGNKRPQVWSESGDAAREITRRLSSLARTREWWKVAGIFLEMERRNAEANKYHFNAAINVMVKSKQSRRAEQWLIFMQEAGVQPDMVSYNSVMQAYVQTGDVAGVEQVLKRMQHAEKVLGTHKSSESSS